jgi:hypothetical protein
MIHRALAPYSAPPLPAHPDQLFAVTAFFNPRRFRSRPRLYHAFKKHMEDSGVKLLTVEVAFGDRPFEVTDPFDLWNVQLRTGTELWHKERALNIGLDRVRQIAPKAKYLAWIDADVTFIRPDWVQETIQQLQHHPVIQLFGDVVNLGPEGHVQWTASSTFRAFFWMSQKLDGGKFYEGDDKGGHPGLAWAATSEALDHLGGLIDFCIAGSGDSHMANSLKGHWNRGVGVDFQKDLNGFSEGFVALLRRWGARASDFHANIGFVPGTIAHHWHGKSSERGYKPRMDILQTYKFDPAEDLVKDEQGLWRYLGNKPEMEAAIRRTMILRNEDSIDA